MRKKLTIYTLDHADLRFLVTPFDDLTPMKLCLRAKHQRHSLPKAQSSLCRSLPFPKPAVG